MEGDLTSRYDYGEFATVEDNWSQGRTMNPHNFNFNDGMFTNFEDLGQLWLWDVDNFNL